MNRINQNGNAKLSPAQEFLFEVEPLIHEITDYLKMASLALESGGTLELPYATVKAATRVVDDARIRVDELTRYFENAHANEICAMDVAA